MISTLLLGPNQLSIIIDHIHNYIHDFTITYLYHFHTYEHDLNLAPKSAKIFEAKL